ncbi:MAG: hypothetical protein ACE5FW_00465 [Candidatus Aenigmatarchaeota archaeon]
MSSTVRERLRQLTELGVDVTFSGESGEGALRRGHPSSLVGVFEDGEEYILSGKSSISPKSRGENPNQYGVMLGILESEGVDTGDIPSVRMETHYIFNRETGEAFYFDLPSRKYLKSKSLG